MAEPTTTSGAEPLTEAEQKTLDELSARKAKAAAEAVEQDRKDQLARLASVDALVKAIKSAKVAEALDAVMNDTAVTFDDKARVQAFKSALDYNIGGLADRIAALSAKAA